MKNALKKELSHIRELGWDADQTAAYLSISRETLTSINRKGIASSTTTSKTKKLTFFRRFLSELADGGFIPNQELVNSIFIIPGKTFASFIDEHYKIKDEVVDHLIDMSVSKFVSSRLRIDYVSEFETKFGDVTEGNLSRAATENPQFLAEFAVHAEIKPLTRAIALSKLGTSLDDSFIGFLKTQTKHELPLVREGAFQGLAHYYFDDEYAYEDLLPFFRNALQAEPGEGVKSQIRGLIEAMEFYRE
jgi:hypothetical protein